VIDCPALKPWELAKFATDRARRLGARLDGEAAQRLVEAVGSEARAIAGAVEQLASDSSAPTLTAAHVRRYFAGRAEVSSFAVAEDVLAGNYGPAIEKLRWALSTGVAPVLVTSALAGSFRALGKYFEARADRRPEPAIAKDVGVPPWKLKDLARQAARGRPPPSAPPSKPWPPRMPMSRAPRSTPSSPSSVCSPSSATAWSPPRSVERACERRPDLSRSACTQWSET